MRILLTGGMGFIGSHTAVTLLEAGHHVVLYDNLSNADAGVAARIEKITGRAPVFVEGDIRDAALLERVLRRESIEAVIHFAVFQVSAEEDVGDVAGSQQHALMSGPVSLGLYLPIDGVLER